MVSDELQPGSWDIVRELVWSGHPLMVAAADEIKRLRAEIVTLRTEIETLEARRVRT